MRKDASSSSHIEIETFVNSIDILINGNLTNQQGKEIVLLVETDIKNGDKFYTDSNGLEL